MKVIISKKKRDEIERLVWAGMGVSAIISSMNGGIMTEAHAQQNHKILQMIMDILDNKTNVKPHNKSKK